MASQDLLAAAQTVAQVQLDYARRGLNLASAALMGSRVMQMWRHYPERDVLDRDHGARFFYHAHPRARTRCAEHGHFHLFFDDRHRSGSLGLAHIAGLSLSPDGQALRWFSTNRWVTGEQWCSAERLVAALPGLELQARGRLAPVARWLGAMTILFSAQIVRMLRQRDERMRSLMERMGREAALENRQVEVLSSVAVSVSHRLTQVCA